MHVEPAGRVGPRTPFGPSEVTRGSRPIASWPPACHGSAPAVKAAFCPTLRPRISSANREGSIGHSAEGVFMSGNPSEAARSRCFDRP